MGVSGLPLNEAGGGADAQGAAGREGFRELLSAPLQERYIFPTCKEREGYSTKRKTALSTVLKVFRLLIIFHVLL